MPERRLFVLTTFSFPQSHLHISWDRPCWVVGNTLTATSMPKRRPILSEAGIRCVFIARIVAVWRSNV